MVSQDYEDLFKILNACKIKYLIVGAHAVTFYTEPRFTKDIDVWIPAELNPPGKIHAALKKFGAPLQDISAEDFMDQKMILQIGVAPVRVDILMSVPGVSIAQAWKNKKRGRYGKTKVFVLGLTDLIRAKRAAGRPQDKLDLKKLLARKRK